MIRMHCNWTQIYHDCSRLWTDSLCKLIAFLWKTPWKNSLERLIGKTRWKDSLERLHWKTFCKDTLQDLFLHLLISGSVKLVVGYNVIGRRKFHFCNEVIRSYCLNHSAFCQFVYETKILWILREHVSTWSLNCDTISSTEKSAMLS